METPTNWHFCSDTTTQNKLAKDFQNCITKLQIHITKEGCKSRVFKEETCLNLDEIEVFKAKKERRNKRSTVDAAIGLKKLSISKILLLDFKFNVKSPRNINRREIDSKIEYSKTLFTDGIQFYNTIYLIFQKEIKNEAISHIRRLYQNKKYVIALDIEELKKWHFEI